MELVDVTVPMYSRVRAMGLAWARMYRQHLWIGRVIECRYGKCYCEVLNSIILGASRAGDSAVAKINHSVKPWKTTAQQVSDLDHLLVSYLLAVLAINDQVRSCPSLSCSRAVVLGARIFHIWSLTDTAIAPDEFPRNAQVVNGLFPGPLLTANKGDSVVINGQNTLFDPTMCRSTSIVRALSVLSRRMG